MCVYQLVSSHRRRWRDSPSSIEGHRLKEECTVCSSASFFLGGGGGGRVVINTRYILVLKLSLPC